MNAKKIFITALIAIVQTTLHPVIAQDTNEKGLSHISAERARNYISFLADDLLQGREAGTPGGQIAANYIVSLLRDWGIKPFLTDDYRQPFDAARVTNPQSGNWQIHPDSIAGIKALGAHSIRHMNNLLAAIPGRSNEIVVIGAHYDHLGIMDDIGEDGCYNGADDNASGVSAVLQIAKAIKESGITPERTIVFAFWDGEEKGLLGSKHFVHTYSNPEQIKAYMNFDMVGRGPEHNPRHLSYMYTASYPAFGDWLRNDMERHSFKFDPEYKAWDNPTGGSDNAPFALAGIPIVWYHTEGHPDYHRPSDHSDKIDYTKLTDITRAAYLCALRLANEKIY